MDELFIVLDLDETVVHASDNFERLKETGIFSNPNLINLRSRVFYFDLESVIFNQDSRNRMWAVIRPGFREFLNFCNSRHYKIIVWSAGHAQYVDQIVRRLFRDGPQPLMVWSHDDCRFKGNKEYDKPLEKLYSAEPRCRPNNTLIIDDRRTNFSESNPDNGIRIPPYEPELTIEGISEPDEALDQIVDWLARIPPGDVRRVQKIFS